MTISSRVRGVMNAVRTPFMAYYRRCREAWRLQRFRALPRATVDISNLGRMDLRRLQGLFESEPTQEWVQDRRVIDSLELPDLTGGVNPGDRRALHALLLGLRPKTVLEVGTHLGCSTVSLALAARRTGCRILTCDIVDVNDPVAQRWKRYGSRYAPRELMKRADCADVVTFLVGSSLDLLRKPGEAFDLIFLDGDHAAAAVYQELPLALAALRPGGFVLLHDYYPDNLPLWGSEPALPGPYLAVTRLVTEGAALVVLPMGELPWPTRSGTRRSSLALVARAN